MSSISLVGAVGGAGTTRLALECGALLAREGRSVAVLDADYATQGLADYLPGRIDCDVTDLCTGEASAGSPSLAAGLVDVETDPGRLAVCPARAPFERLARAKAPEAARRFASLVGTAGESFDHVLVDAPPVAANQAVAAVTTTDRVALVAPDTPRGRDGLARQRDRLADVGAPKPRTVLTFVEGSTAVERTTAADGSVADEGSTTAEDAADGEASTGAERSVDGASASNRVTIDATVPEHEATDPHAVPVCTEGTGPFVASVAETCETLLDESLAVDVEDAGVLDRLRPGR